MVFLPVLSVWCLVLKPNIIFGQSVQVNVEEKIMLEEKVYRAAVFRFEADAGTSIRDI